MRILVTNDDGIYSPGILALARAAQRFGDVRVVAPDVEQSSMGQAITSTRPLSYRATKLDGIEAYRVNGTPADCVALGAHNWEQVDAVLSGINLGPNLGNSIWHSGTLAAAKQAALLGLRGIALSTPAGNSEPDFDRIDPYGRTLAYIWLGGTLFNETLVRDGFATVATYPPDTRYVQRFQAAQRDARGDGRGLWGAC